MYAPADGRVFVEGSTVQVMIDAHGRPRPIPPDFLAALSEYVGD
jgi:acyl-CoA thioesterase FadM